MGEQLLLSLRALGVKDFFANPGTEFASLIHGFETLDRELIPKAHLCGHELLALNLAYGKSLASSTQGQPEVAAVMTHANVGLANLSMGVIGANRMQIPMLVIAGHTSETETGYGARDKNIHWAQNARDQSASVREYVKFECHLRDPHALHATLARALAIAKSPPMGPVLVTLSRDFLMSPVDSSISVNSWPASIERGKFRSTDLSADLLIKFRSAKRVVAITNRLGRSIENRQALVSWSDKHQIGILTPDDYYASFPIDHSGFLGSKNEKALREAELIFVFDTDAPWFPLLEGPRDAIVVHVGEVPLWDSIPLRSHKCDLAISADCGDVIAALMSVETSENVLSARNVWVRENRHQPQVCGSKLRPPSIAQDLNSSLRPGDTVWNELGLKHTDFVTLQAGSYFRSGAASPLGWAVGAALGHALEKPGTTTNIVVGDGVLQLSPVLAMLQFIQDQFAKGVDLRIRLLVLNNGGLKSIEESVRAFFPDLNREVALTQHGPSLQYQELARLVGGSGKTIHTREELKAALHTLEPQSFQILNLVLQEK